MGLVIPKASMPHALACGTIHLVSVCHVDTTSIPSNLRMSFEVALADPASGPDAAHGRPRSC